MTYDGTILVTGGTSGLGYHTALELARRHPEYLVVVAARSDRESAAATINKHLKQDNTIFLPLDLSSLANVRAFAKNWARKDYAPIQLMLLNAALQFPGTMQKTGDGIESTFAIGHVGHALLFHLLFDCLAPAARIVVTSSGTHDPAQKTGMPPAEYVSAEEMAHPSPASNAQPGRKRYTSTKLANVLWTYALQRRLDRLSDGTKMSVAAIDPGLLPGTGLARNTGAFGRWVWLVLLPRIIPLLRLMLGPNIYSPSEAAKNLAWLADSAGHNEAAGAYFEGRKKIPSSAASYDVAKQEDLWDWTVRNVALDEVERKKFGI